MQAACRHRGKKPCSMKGVKGGRACIMPAAKGDALNRSDTCVSTPGSKSSLLQVPDSAPVQQVFVGSTLSQRPLAAQHSKAQQSTTKHSTAQQSTQHTAHSTRCKAAAPGTGATCKIGLSNLLGRPPSKSGKQAASRMHQAQAKVLRCNRERPVGTPPPRPSCSCVGRNTG